MIHLIDDQIKRFIESIKQRGEWDNTIFIILSDHGDFCGEYGLIRKGAGLSESLTRIPMVWAGGGIKKHDGAMTDFVSITDIYPTICTAIGDTIPLDNGDYSELKILAKADTTGFTFLGLNEMEHAGFTSAVIRGLKAGLSSK